MELKTDSLDVVAGGKKLVSGLELTVTSGQCWFVYGRNGAGKTTLLQTLAGLRVPDGGSVLLDGRMLSAWPFDELARMRGYLPQKQRDAFGFSVFDLVLSARFPWHGGRIWESDADCVPVVAALKQMDALALADRDVRTLSGGERQRVAIAALLAQDTPLMLLDEPATALDLAYQATLMQQMAVWCRECGKAVVTVVHDLNLAWQVATHVLLLYGDGQWEAGTCTAMMTTEKLSRCLRHPVCSAVCDGRQVFMTF